MNDTERDLIAFLVAIEPVLSDFQTTFTAIMYVIRVIGVSIYKIYVVS